MSWIYNTNDPLMETFLGVIFLAIIIIIITRIIGLRSFAKFTAFDFAFTVAIGSIISSTLTSSTTIAQGGVAIFSILIITYTISFLQRKYKFISNSISNKPLLLMKGSIILEENLKKARIEKSQLMAKLREANVYQLEQVLAVILENTGDISVLHSANMEGFDAIDQEILNGIKE